MNSTSDHLTQKFGRINSSRFSGSSDIFEPTITRINSIETKQQTLIEWINGILPSFNLPSKASTEELRASLIDGTVLLQILNKLRPGSVTEGGGSDHSSSSRSENVKKFLANMDELAIPRFEISDLEKGSMKTVTDCLLTLRAQSGHAGDNLSTTSASTKGGSPHGPTSPRSAEEKQKISPESKFQLASRSSLMTDTPTALMHHVGHKFHEVFQLKQGRYADLSAAKISEMMKSNSLDNAPTQSLLSVVNGILDESIERKNGEIPHRVACLLRKVVQEIERRISTQAEHLRTQNNLFKAREEKFQSRIRVLEALASGNGEETGFSAGQLRQIKLDLLCSFLIDTSTSLPITCSEKSKTDEKKKFEEEDVMRLMKEKEQTDLEFSMLKRELEIAKKALELEKSKMDEKRKLGDEDLTRLMKEKEETDLALSSLKQELQITKKTLELEKSKMNEEMKNGGDDVLRLMKEKEQTNIELSMLKRELEIANRTHEHEKSKIYEKRKTEEEDAIKLEKEKERINVELSALKQELKIAKEKHELHCLQMEKDAKDVREELEARIKELGSLLEDSRSKVKVLEVYSESKQQLWKKKELIFQNLVEFQLGALQELRLSSDGIKREILRTQRSYSEDFNSLGLKFRALVDASENYHLVLAENRKMFNELQDLKGNIRVYCRIRPLLKEHAGKNTTIEHIGENGELIVANPSKQGKDGHRLFRFNIVYGSDSTQAEVFSDTQPLIRSVLDGYNVCIFAYGQTGSGKTYTMTGPDGATEEEWGVNYRALNDLFNISQRRSTSFMYEVGVQMFEIYNEQLRDLLANDGSQKRLGIKTIPQPNGLAVPDAILHPVTSTSDVIQLMEIGLNNRAVGATALNERSSRSHSVVSIHVRGKDLKTGSNLQGNLHLVDLAGSERVDRSEVTGDRLKEAQHINKSLSALGDVIFALAQKSSHIPYRNSKLTQLLQSSLGGQAKTLMFVQLNPDVTSYSETMSTLKFAERVSGVELGAAKSSKDGNVRELMEQVASLKDTIAKKDGEIERLQLLKDLKNAYPGVNGDKQGTGLSKYAYSEYSDKHPETDLHSQQSMEDIKQENRFHRQLKFSRGDTNKDVAAADVELLGYSDGDRDDRSSDFSDGGLSDGLTDESTKLSDRSEKTRVASRVRSLQKLGQTTTTASRESLRGSTSVKKTASSSSLGARPPRRWQ
ncbi:kinesin-like protein KIN-14M isoform X1 [Ricinus communis]|uniref:kinesin-like protein KIN-14M isoform X1 n=1 Tax=Ricinus communis TaxID=3988 RepID=UPI000772A07B|nr:kinesin-like protein KIN-14M isoform X1 [Ricinus communis]|eukprot:XP_015582690.1 kinesin-like protein KIN-14M isoform X2 [Ricinus communis]